MKSYKTAVIAATLLATLASIAPVASASQKSKNDWRNLGTGAAAVGVLGAIKGDKTMTGVGLAGAGYSAYRYEQDRKHQSQESAARKRARYHSRHRRHH
ncbi:MAG TPA: hypothetical protein VGK19_12825 [Capsulimonadaceae bacterium]|jgi:uncharacterized membrane protein YebE (DUF533 family)